MSNHYQLHAMTSLYAPMIMKLKPNEENSEKANQIKVARKKFQDHLSIKDDSSVAAINSTNPEDWVITNLSYPTNYLPKGTVFKHISFIPTNVPDFRKVVLSVKDHTEFDGGALKSTEVNRERLDTINKREIKSMLTTITGTPLINETANVKDLPSLSVISRAIADFLVVNMATGTNDITMPQLKLMISNKIKNSQLQQAVKNHVYNAIDTTFTELADKKANVVANNQQAEDTFIYIVEKILNNVV